MDTSNAPPSSGSEEQINSIMAMGFTKEQAVEALKAAFGNAARAVEYLTSGNIPSGNDAMETDDKPSTTESTTESTTTTTTPPAETPSSGPPQALSEDSPLYFLLQNPQFMTIRNFVQQQPHMLPALLQEITREQPELVRLVNENRDDFYNLLNTPVEEGQGQSPGDGGQQQRRGQPQQLQVTPEENAAIDRLCAMGFEKGLVVQAYFACEKNEELAANYLLEDAMN